MSALTELGKKYDSLRMARDILERPGEVTTRPWWPMPETFASSAERRRAEQAQQQSDHDPHEISMSMRVR